MSKFVSCFLKLLFPIRNIFLVSVSCLFFYLVDCCFHSVGLFFVVIISLFLYRVKSKFTFDMSTIQFNAQQESISAFLDYLHDYQVICFNYQCANAQDCYELQMRLDKLEHEYIASCSEISVFLNYINFFAFRDYGCYVDLLFTCNSCC